MKAKELLRRYRTGERDFQGVDLSGESLRGMNLAGTDLSGANLSQTDLRGTKFTDAKLIGTQLCESKTGSQRRWLILIVLFSLALAGLASVLLGLFVAVFLTPIISPISTVTNSVAGDVAFGSVGLGMIAVTLYFNYRQGTLVTLGAFAFVGAVVFAVTFAFAVFFASSGSGTIAFVNVGAVAFAGAGAVASAGAVAVAFAVADVFSVAVAVAVAVAGSFAVTVADERANGLILIGLTVVIVLIVTRFNWLTSRRALSGDPRDKLIRDMAVGLTSLSSTRFDHADLTDAN